MSAKQLPPPLIPLVKPYVDTSIANLTEPNARHVVRTIAGWLTSVSYHPRTKLFARVALRVTARLLHKEASRLIPPEATNVPSD